MNIKAHAVNKMAGTFGKIFVLRSTVVRLPVIKIL